jgi:lipopolysaccharide biosynthesis glycosyltransferase
MKSVYTKNLVYQGKVNLSPDHIVVVCSADNNYAMPLAVTVRSALENLNHNCKILLFIIDGGIKKNNKQKILKSLSCDKCEVEFLPVPQSLIKEIEESHNDLIQNEDRNRTRRINHISIASYYRLVIPELLPHWIEKVIYLDCDLVVNGDLKQLWKMDLKENYVLAAQDVSICYVSAPNGLLNHEELGISPESKYFNAGVLTINLKKWRDDKITTKAVEYFQQNKEFVRWHDQDVLNAVLAGQWGELHPKWNFQPMIDAYSSWEASPFSEEVYNDLMYTPYIIHYVTRLKPWNFYYTPYKEYFFQYVDKTLWSGWRLTFWKRVWITARREFQKTIYRVRK